jgi:LysR family transcriptional regulator, transcriptional activator for dmlA
MEGSLDLQFFCLVARRGSLSGAARELGVTPSAVSKRLAQLERRLGVQLFNRTTRHVNLTQHGALYFERASRIVQEIEEVERLVTASRSAPRGLLRINATFTFGRTQVAPVASEFVKRYPETEVQLQLTDRPLNLAEEGYDLAIRFGEPPDARVSARKIAQNRRLLCATPAYLARAGTPRSPADLADHACIVIRQDESAYGALRLTRGRKTQTVKVRGALSTNDPEVALAWALDGHGIVVRSEWEAGEYLRAGRLREVLPLYSLPPADIYAVYPPRHRHSPTIRLFIDFLVAHVDKLKRG